MIKGLHHVTLSALKTTRKSCEETEKKLESLFYFILLLASHNTNNAILNTAYTYGDNVQY